jgi:hypothetical protein
VAQLTAHTLGGLTIVAGILTVLIACQPYAPEDDGALAFVLPGAHETLTCEQCHGPPPFVAFQWDTTCLSCHEPDRKPPDPTTGAEHYPGQSCSGATCHADTDFKWIDALGALGNVDHDFLPLEGSHALGCNLCHGTANPSEADVFPNDATADRCWDCHEEDRKIEVATGTAAAPLHYVEDTAIIALDAEPRWDCKACHDNPSRGEGPLDGWAIDPAKIHGGIRYPHGMQIGPTKAVQTAVPPGEWIFDCVACHPVAPPDAVCVEACHGGGGGTGQDIFTYPIAFHAALTPESPAATCGATPACHPAADNIPRPP